MSFSYHFLFPSPFSWEVYQNWIRCMLCKMEKQGTCNTNSWTHGVWARRSITFFSASFDQPREILWVSPSCAPLPHHDNSTLYYIWKCWSASVQNSAPQFWLFMLHIEGELLYIIIIFFIIPPFIQHLACLPLHMMRLTTLISVWNQCKR